MKKTNILSCIALLMLFCTPIQAQYWADWHSFVHVEGGFWVFPKNIEKFKTAQTQIWSNNQWRDSSRFVNTYDGNSLLKMLKTADFTNGQWVESATYLFDFDNNANWANLQVGLGTPPAFAPQQRIAHTYNMGRLVKSLVERYTNNHWERAVLDSNVYGLSGRQTFYYRFTWDSSRWKQSQKDSFVYDVNGRMTARWSLNSIGEPNGRIVYSYTSANQIRNIRFEVFDPANPLNWQIFWNSDYTYNAQNQLIELRIESFMLPWLFGSDITAQRYQFTVDAQGKILEEVRAEYNSLTQIWTNSAKTVYTYHQVGTIELAPAGLLNVAPNPVHNGALHLTLQDANYQMQLVELYDIYGHNVFNQSIENQSIIDLNLTGIQNGQYLLKVTTDKGMITQKVLVLH